MRNNDCFMFIMTIIFALTVLFIKGCGADPDDYTVQKSDGCPSSGCVKEVETASPEVAEVAPPAVTEPAKISDLQCADNKLCIGMSQSEALDILPNGPDSAVTFSNSIILEFHESTWDHEICALTVTPNQYFEWGISCSVTFKNNKLLFQRDIDVKWLDLGGF